MPGEFDELFSFLEDDGLTIPGVISREHPEGRDYVIPSPDGETGARLTALGELGIKVNKGVEVKERDVRRLQMDDAEEREFMEQVLGSAFKEMMDDGVSWVRMQRINQYAFTHFAISDEAARAAALKGAFSGTGKAPALNRQERRAQGRKTTTKKTR